MSAMFEGAQFEIMPFGAGGAQHEEELEEERWARGRGRGAGSRRAPSKFSGRPPGRPPGTGRYRRPWPRFPVVAWPVPAWSEPEPPAPDAAEPFPAPGDEPPDDGAEGEVSKAERDVLMRFPPALRAVLLALPDDERPRYVPIGMLPRAAHNPAANKPGLYMIVFTTRGHKQAYNGISGHVRLRLQKHLLSATALGLRHLVNNHEVFFAPAPGTARPRDIELKINKLMLKPFPDVLTNQQYEFEAELSGEAWP